MYSYRWYTYSGGQLTEEITSYLQQQSSNPSVYTKLSCFLPWIAEQYNMDYDNTGLDTDDECTTSIGDKNDIANDGECRTSGEYNDEGERPCLFPFYWNGKLYDQCIMLEEDDAILPVFRCPTVNTVNKIDGINAWNYSDFEKHMKYGRLCVDTIDEDCNAVDEFQGVNRPAGKCITVDPNGLPDEVTPSCSGREKQGVFQPCKNNCKGGMKTSKK